MKRFLAKLLCVFLVVLPVVALATGPPDLDMGDLIGPEVGVGVSLLVVVILIVTDTLLGVLVAKKND